MKNIKLYTIKNNAHAKIKESIKNPIEIKSPEQIGLTEISLKKFQLLLIATNLITGIK